MNLFTKLNVTVRETKRIVEIFSNTVKKRWNGCMYRL